MLKCSLSPCHPITVSPCHPCIRLAAGPIWLAMALACLTMSGAPISICRPVSLPGQIPPLQAHTRLKMTNNFDRAVKWVLDWETAGGKKIRVLDQDGRTLAGVCSRFFPAWVSEWWDKQDVAVLAAAREFYYREFCREYAPTHFLRKPEQSFLLFSGGKQAARKSCSPARQPR